MPLQDLLTGQRGEQEGRKCRECTKSHLHSDTQTTADSGSQKVCRHQPKPGRRGQSLREPGGTAPRAAQLKVCHQSPAQQRDFN